MPVFVEHIDAIARAKEAAALYLEFHPQGVDLWRDDTYDHDPRHAGVPFCVMPLAYAMRNITHDEPGFRARWAEDF
ncbi:MAG: hypothetical protein K2X55_20340 [Burkholderiaceae bacterium]|nr:hypothetical protein [Burkholderiaceae bacterium]